MSDVVENLRIHVYGTQGSSSTFPSRRELETYQQHHDYALLKRVIADLQKYKDDDGRVSCTVEELLGGPIDDDTLMKYRATLNVQLRVYGGWTTCIRVETADGYEIVLDCGSGFRNCAKELQRKWGDSAERHLHVLGSHSHLDHTEGFDQAAVCFDPRNTIHVYGNATFLSALDGYLGIFSRSVRDDLRGLYTPLSYDNMPARFAGVEIRGPEAEGEPKHWSLHDIAEPLQFGDTRVTPFEVYHTSPCLGYVIQRGGRTFVYCTDHELRHAIEPDEPAQQKSETAEARLVELCKDADLLYRDAQYLRAEYDGLQGIGTSAALCRRDWGHSCIEDVLEMAFRCHIRRTLLGHHDPNREWPERNSLDEYLAGICAKRTERVEMAQAGVVIDI